jgi:hypothetical protein
MGGVFINYRIVDQPVGAAAIAAFLADRFGPDRVFRDVVSLAAGDDYPTALRDALAQADALVAVIGPNWATLTDEHGTRLIDREHDWVRREIADALRRGIPVIPVLLTDTPANATPPRPEDLPADIARLARVQAMEISQKRFGADVARLADALVTKVPQLIAPQLFTPPPDRADADAAPSTLLRAEYATVPFTGRDAPLTDLLAWANDTATCSVRLVVGPPGSGKTRLAGELCRQLTGHRWLAGAVSGDTPATQIRATAALDRPLLVVVDDVETRADQLVALAAALNDRARRAPARLLLLGRFDGGWLRELRAHRDDRVAELFRPLDHTSTLDLTAFPVPATGQARAATAAWAGRLGLPEDTAPPDDLGEPDSVLATHTAVLTTLLDQVLGTAGSPAVAGSGAGSPAAAGARAESPLVRLLAHDRRHWRDRFPDLDPAELAVIGTLATLSPPNSPQRADALVARLPDFLGVTGPDLAAHLAGWRALCPGPHAVNPLHPEPLGAQLVADTLADRPTVLVTLAATVGDDQLVTPLTVLGRALPRHPGLAQAVADLVRVAPERIALLAVGVTERLAQPEPFTRAVATALGDSELGVDVVFQLMRRLQAPNASQNALRGVAFDQYVNRFARPVRDSLRRENPGFEQLQRVLDGVVDLMQDGFVGLLDPASGRFPTGPDGRPILPPEQLDTLRNLLTSDWLRHDDDQR